MLHRPRHLRATPPKDASSAVTDVDKARAVLTSPALSFATEQQKVEILKAEGIGQAAIDEALSGLSPSASAPSPPVAAAASSESSAPPPATPPPPPPRRPLRQSPLPQSVRLGLSNSWSEVLLSSSTICLRRRRRRRRRLCSVRRRPSP